jgi:hypothetical protein
MVPRERLERERIRYLSREERRAYLVKIDHVIICHSRRHSRCWLRALTDCRKVGFVGIGRAKESTHPKNTLIAPTVYYPSIPANPNQAYGISRRRSRERGRNRSRGAVDPLSVSHAVCTSSTRPQTRPTKQKRQRPGFSSQIQNGVSILRPSYSRQASPLFSPRKHVDICRRCFIPTVIIFFLLPPVPLFFFVCGKY